MPQTSKIAALPRKRRVLAGLVVLLLLALFVRWICVASRTEIGWEIMAQQWHDATAGVFIRDPQLLANLEPADQATFWLRETQRIVAEEPENAELAAGAALLLSSPDMSFMYHYATVSDLPLNNHSVVIPQWDNKVIARAINEFHARCRAKCLALAAKATELQPKETRWRRLRAFLLFIGDPFSGCEGASRVPDWLRVLQQCRDHDPDNALYDYLAAWQYWGESVDQGELAMPIIDRVKFDLGTEYFLRGQRKRFFAVGGGEWPLVIGAIRRMSLLRCEYYDVAGGRFMENRALRLTRELERTTSIHAEQLEISGDLAGALALHRQTLRMFDQFFARPGEELPSEYVYFDYMYLLRRSAIASLWTFAGKHPELVSADEAARLKKASEIAERDERTCQTASYRLAVKRNPPNMPFFFAVGILANLAASTVAILLLAGAMACVSAGCLHKPGEPNAARLGVVRHLAGWVAGYALTFVVFGMAPAEIIPPAVQHWLFAGAIALLSVAVACWVVIRRRLQFTIRTLLGVTLVWAIFLSILKSADLMPQSFSDFHMPALSVPPRDIGGLDARLFQQPIIMIYGRWSWAVYQWMLYAEPYAGIGAALAIIAVWHQIRFRRMMKARPGDLAVMEAIPPRRRWAERFACLGRSMLTAAALWMLAYLWFMPAVLQFSENVYQTKMAYLRNPREYIDAMTKTMAEVRAEDGEKSPK